MDISLHQDPCKRTKLKTDDTENACAFPAPDGRTSRGLEANVFMFEAKREGVSVFGANGVRLPRIMAPATLHLYSHHHRLVLPRARRMYQNRNSQSFLSFRAKRRI